MYQKRHLKPEFFFFFLEILRKGQSDKLDSFYLFIYATYDKLEPFYLHASFYVSVRYK